MYRCTECDSEKVYADAWVNLNDETDVLGPYAEFYCSKCDGSTGVYEETEDE